MDTIQTRTAAPLHFYAPPQVVRNKLLLVGGIMGMVVVVGLMSASRDTGAVFLFSLALLVVCEALVLAAMRFSRLTISDEGIRYRAAGYSVFASWDNMIGISTQQIGNQGEVDGLVLRESGLEANGWLVFLAMFSFSASAAFNAQEHFLPISNLLSDHWWTSPFADELRRRAPHLFNSATD